MGATSDGGKSLCESSSSSVRSAVGGLTHAPDTQTAVDHCQWQSISVPCGGVLTQTRPKASDAIDPSWWYSTVAQLRRQPRREVIAVPRQQVVRRPRKLLLELIEDGVDRHIVQPADPDRYRHLVDGLLWNIPRSRRKDTRQTFDVVSAKSPLPVPNDHSRVVDRQPDGPEKRRYPRRWQEVVHVQADGDASRLILAVIVSHGNGSDYLCRHVWPALYLDNCLVLLSGSIVLVCCGS